MSTHPIQADRRALLDELRAIEKACAEPALQAAMNRHRLAIEKVYSAEDWPEGSEYDALISEEMDAMEALAIAPCGSLDALLQKLSYINVFKRCTEDEPDTENGYGALAIAVEAYWKRAA
jgi:hypothetical protein